MVQGRAAGVRGFSCWGDRYRYTVISTFPDGSIRARRSDKALG